MIQHKAVNKPLNLGAFFQRHPRGFTLLEVLIALMIIAGSIVALSTAWSNNFMRFRKSKNYHQVALLLERKMVELEEEFRDKPVASMPEKLNGNFGKDFPKARWEFESQDFVMPNLKPLMISEGQGNDMLLGIVQRMEDYFNASVKEAKLTVFVKINKNKEVKYTITRYFVDYSQQLGGAGGG